MKQGIIMEIDDEFLTLLTPEGEFLHTRRLNQPYVIGEEIHFFQIERVKTLNSFNPLKNIFKFKPVCVIMAAIVILLGSFIPMYQNNKAYAYMSIDVNPSIELGVNKKMEVVEITGFNKDGKKIVSHLSNWKKKNVSKLAKTIMVEMNKEGYLNTKEHVIISTVRMKEPDSKVEQKLQENIEEIKASVKEQRVEITVLNATQEERDQAQRLGISTGKLQDNKNQAQVSRTNNMTTKEQKKPVDSKAIQKKPADSKPAEPIKKQTEKKAVQNKGITGIKKQLENKWINGKSIPPGQWKKIEQENNSKPNQDSAKSQNNSKEIRSENKKSLNQEEQKEKERKTNTVKTNNVQKSKNKEKDTKKQNKIQNNKKQDNKSNKKSYGNPRNSQKNK